MKKLISIFLCLLTVIGMTRVCSVKAEDKPVYSGQCGENVFWSIDPKTWALTISGSGEMEWLGSSDRIPWKDYREMITAVRIEEGITHIDSACFFNCMSLTELVLPSTVQYASNSTCMGCDSMKKVTFLNPECYIPDGEDTAAHAAVCGYADSTAYAFAMKNGHTFIDIETGDVIPFVGDSVQQREYHNEFNDNWVVPVRSYLYEDRGMLIRVDAGGLVTVTSYDAGYEEKSFLALKPELPLFGGLLAGTNYNFIIYGQANPHEDDHTEVFRIVKYDKQWNRIDAVSVYGANTYMPFEDGLARLTECGNMLYIHTCHKIYAIGGLRHQTNALFSIRISDLKIMDQVTDVTYHSRGYASHSFNQFITVDGTDLLTLTHSDAYPRAAAIFRFDSSAGQETALEDADYEEVFPFSGFEGNNKTGAYIGGFEASSSSYLIAGCSIPQDGSVTYSSPKKNQKNIFIAVTSKDSFSAENTEIRWITNYKQDGDLITMSAPKLVKISENKFLLMWMENEVLHYCFVDAKGKAISREVTHDGVSLSDCQPVVYKNKVVWYAKATGEAPYFCQIDLSSPSSLKKIHMCVFKTVNTYADCSKPGTAEKICVHCGKKISLGVVPPTSHSWDKGRITKRATYFEKGIKTFTCRRCGKTRTEEILVRNINEPCDGTEICPGHHFTDMPKAGNWAHAGIDWAIIKKITTGTSKTTFSPDAGCTRAQVVTFLWRAAGAPEPKQKENPFADVTANKYYYKAVLWAVENRITNGTGKTTFSPDETCTRGQIVTFLWRFRDKAKPKNARTGFSDVSDSAFYAKAVAWAVETKVTKGTTATTFAPDATCTRAQVVTFLHRACTDSE